MTVYQHIVSAAQAGKKQFAVLIDPDKSDTAETEKTARLGTEAGADFFFVGGSLLTQDCLEKCILTIKKNSDLPVVIFPGSTLQITPAADAILFLSLISGRNPEMLIGHHVVAAPMLKAAGIEVISTGYMLIDSGRPTTASYMSSTTPIPHDKDDIALCTALAGEMLGMKMIFMDGGSGAKYPVSESMIRHVKQNLSIPLIIGGGIATPEKASANCRAGADIIVVGNSIEKDKGLIAEISSAVCSA